jgi:hypothetical protein
MTRPDSLKVRGEFRKSVEGKNLLMCGLVRFGPECCRNTADGRRRSLCPSERGRQKEGEGESGGLEPLQRYNPHFIEGFSMVHPLQRRYNGATGAEHFKRLKGEA